MRGSGRGRLRGGRESGNPVADYVSSRHSRTNASGLDRRLSIVASSKKDQEINVDIKRKILSDIKSLFYLSLYCGNAFNK